LKDLSLKYSQLEQLVCNVIQQQQYNSNVGTYRTGGDNNMAYNIVLKSVLLDILQAKTVLKGTQNYIPSLIFQDVESNLIYSPIASLLQKTENILKSGPFGLPILTETNFESFDAAAVLKENQQLSQRIFSQFAIAPPICDPMSITTFPSIALRPLEMLDQTIPTRAGLEKLVAAIETIEPTC
jgi:hypothetical protein